MAWAISLGPLRRFLDFFPYPIRAAFYLENSRSNENARLAIFELDDTGEATALAPRVYGGETIGRRGFVGPRPVGNLGRDCSLCGDASESSVYRILEVTFLIAVPTIAIIFFKSRIEIESGGINTMTLPSGRKSRP